MSLIQRPYAGTWGPNRRGLVQHTPDCLVYLNGDTTIAGCSSCNRRINFNRYITSVSVDASTDSGGHSASISMSVPRHAGDTLFAEGNNKLRVGLEVHVYMRGYFPTQGLYDTVVAGFSARDLPTYPYYHVFHGVVTNVDHDYSGGFYTVSVTCGSMLHFWNYIDITTNGSVFGARPNNSQVRLNLQGHNFNGMSPFSIIYYLYRNDTGAAAGVGYALSQETNLDAVSEVSGDSLYSMVARYWEARFGSRMYGLRMHGASGQLFTASQQAFLSRLSSSEIESILTGSILTQGSEQQQPRDPFVRSAAEQLGFLRRNSFGELVPSLDLLQQDIEDEEGGLGINVAALQAFVQDIGAFGDVNLFESTYQSKLDIANEVCRVTGFEFYQDVDGDLVFKPPLYNLDTTPSRVYRIEPIDLISLNQSEAEPEATYMVVKGSRFRNMTGLGAEGEWGVQGNYVDYRLVAQFGWRRADLDTAYYNNGRSAFFAASAQLDVMNAKVMNTMTATIPLRPEMRPGYPVYISDEDCYYYCDSLSHSYVAGGQCTTTVVGSARRRKFNAPGNPREDGINSIDLSDTSLPPKELVALDEENHPRKIGFPNVVLALDPNRLNPQFLYTAVSTEDIGNEQVIRLLVQKALTLGLIYPVADDRGVVNRDEGPWAVAAGESAQITIPKLRELVSQGAAIIEVEERIAEEVSQDGQEVTDRQREDREEAYDGAQALIDLIELTRTELERSGELRDPESAVSLLDLISQRKASYTNGSTPGTYRYYSSSHPDPEMQGMREISASQFEGTQIRNLYSLLEDKRPGFGFREVEGPAPPGIGSSNYVETVETPSVRAGLNLRRLQSRGPEVVATHEITSLSFSDHSVTRQALRSNLLGDTFSFAVNRARLADTIYRYIRSTYSTVFDDVDPESTPEDVFNPILEILTADTTFNGSESVTALKRGTATDPRASQSFDVISDDLGIEVNEVALRMLRLQAQILAEWCVSYYDVELEEYNLQVVPDEDLAFSEFQTIIDQYRSDARALSDTFVGDLPNTQTYFEETSTGQSYQTPVFPVSDSQGYEVVGSYRYGRGLSIEPGANYSQLMNLDPLRFADPQALDTYVGTLLTTNDEEDLRAAEERLAATLQDEPDAGPGIDVLTRYSDLDPQESSRSEMLRIGLQNFIASERDSVHKLPVQNAAFALTDLQPDVDEEQICLCRGADADIFLDALASGEVTFVSIEDPPDRITAWNSNETIQKSGPWANRQDNLRGTVRSRGPSNTFGSGIFQVPDLSSIAQVARDEAERAQARLDDALGGVDSALGGVDDAIDAFDDL